ncbi:MAG TPA: hypothetical protein VHW09_32765 [Bryobacteraceae bacterium]|nr:hypothetical protein [Bryobacteraceae bacterium]
MRCLKLPVVLAALVSLLASVHCMARCAVMPCGQSGSQSDLPPCHRHSTPAAKPCATPIFMAEARTHGATPIAPLAPAVQVEPAAPPLTRPAAQPRPASPAPDSGGPTIHILRV